MALTPYPLPPSPHGGSWPMTHETIGQILGGFGVGLGTGGTAPAQMRGPSQAQQAPTQQMDPTTLLKSLMGGATGGAASGLDPNLHAILQSYRPDPHDVRAWQDRAGSWGSANFTPQGIWDNETRQQHAMTPKPMQPVVGNYLAGAGGVGSAMGY